MIIDFAEWIRSNLNPLCEHTIIMPQFSVFENQAVSCRQDFVVDELINIAVEKSHTTRSRKNFNKMKKTLTY